ncbi:type 3 dihydrofolate reductase [Amphritea sp. 1_MG-2023]|uniref:type 3 dihydrofolate reductase n=1 Tax=Amphritea sp. 1_MG-2023 TaxID=3062670 RepID=UPI0026E13F5F|nr:type 3 dihydrofolate reductase [Amphritea sp. 1_MG-2023]MDO6565200.1 type 3 dihydrofolate reductase [Amphritea sp. 1_MG-2023]
MHLAIIVAQAENRVIGINNNLPWHLPEDLRYFKQVTMAKPIIMGRKTFESIGRPLPGRTNIVISRDATFQPENVKVVNSLEAAKALAESICTINGGDEAMVIGGAQIYEQALPLCDRLYLTQVHAEVDGDAYFPAFNPGDWAEIGREDFSAAEHNPYDYSFIVLKRIS